MKKTIDFLLVKFIVTAIVTVLDTLFAVIGFSPSTMGICGMIFCVIVYITCMNETNDAFLSVFKWNASNDSFIAFSLIHCSFCKGQIPKYSRRYSFYR